MRIIQLTLLNLSYLNTNIQTYETKTFRGTILFPVSDTIPQSVVVLLCHPNDIQSNVDAFYTYFQSARWTQADLLDEIRKCKKVDVVVDGLEDPVIMLMPPGKQRFYLTYGEIAMKMRPMRKVEYPIIQHRLVLNFDGKCYDIVYMSGPPASAVPFEFKRLDW